MRRKKTIPKKLVPEPIEIQAVEPIELNSDIVLECPFTLTTDDEGKAVEAIDIAKTSNVIYSLWAAPPKTVIDNIGGSGEYKIGNIVNDVLKVDINTIIISSIEFAASGYSENHLVKDILYAYKSFISGSHYQNSHSTIRMDFSNASKTHKEILYVEALSKLLTHIKKFTNYLLLLNITNSSDIMNISESIIDLSTKLMTDYMAQFYAAYFDNISEVTNAIRIKSNQEDTDDYSI